MHPKADMFSIEINVCYVQKRTYPSANFVPENRLKSHPLPVEEVAICAAFGSPSTFYRWFLEKHGIAPAVFRELKK